MATAATATVPTDRVAVTTRLGRRTTHRDRHITPRAPSRRPGLRVRRAHKARRTARAAARRRVARTAAADTPVAVATVTVKNRSNSAIADGPEFFGAVA